MNAVSRTYQGVIIATIHSVFGLTTQFGSFLKLWQNISRRADNLIVALKQISLFALLSL